MGLTALVRRTYLYQKCLDCCELRLVQLDTCKQAVKVDEVTLINVSIACISYVIRCFAPHAGFLSKRKNKYGCILKIELAACMCACNLQLCFSTPKAGGMTMATHHIYHRHAGLAQVWLTVQFED